MNWDDTIAMVLGQLQQLDEPILGRLDGCTRGEIEIIEKDFDCKLPGAYVALLKRIGRNPGGLMTGLDFAFPELLSFRRIANALLEDLEDDEAVDLELDERDFVFLMIQGYQFFFFRAGDSDDPAVFFYDDDDPSFRKISGSFVEWWDFCVKEQLELRI